MTSGYLLCDGTGMLGGRVAHRLAASGREFRALVRKTSDTSALRALGAEMVVGDPRDPDSLGGAARGAHTVISTANSMARVLGGEKSLTIADVDVTGHAESCSNPAPRTIWVQMSRPPRVG